MKILTLCRFVRYITACHFLTSIVLFMILDTNGVSGKADLKTKLLLQNIRTHLARKADEIVKKKECESGLILCKSPKSKETEGDEEKSEEIPPPPKVVRGQHKPVIKVNTKDVIQTLIPKGHKSIFKKSPKLGESERHKQISYSLGTSSESNESDVLQKAKGKKENKYTVVSNLMKPKQVKNETKHQKDSGAKQPKKHKSEDAKYALKDGQKIPVPVTKTGKTKDADEAVKEVEMTKAEHVKKTEKKTVREYERETTERDSIVSLEIPIFGSGSAGLKNDLCQKHSQIYLRQLKKYRIWALMMFDASAKITSGILQGNINNYGDFDECLGINAVFKKHKNKGKDSSGIKGKYCLANVDVTTDSDDENLRSILDRIESFQFIKSNIRDPGHFIPRFSTINWGFCVPSTCLAEDVEMFLRFQLEVLSNATELRFHVKVDESNCVVRDDLKFKFHTGMMATILFYLSVISISLYATFLDTKSKKPTEQKKIEGELMETVEDEILKNGIKFSVKEKTKEILMAFSLKKNVGRLFSESSGGAIECINGIKSIFTVMLYFAHKTIPLGMTPFSNRVLLTKVSHKPATLLLRTSIIYTDSFLLMSGMLTSYNLAREYSENKNPSWVKKAIARFIRLTPALFAVLLLYAYVWDQLGAGPLWNLVVNQNSLLCRKHMWRNLLYIQNFFLFENMCAPQTHQLALDMQLTLLSPMFVHIIYSYDKAGGGILQALFILSSILRYISASNNDLSVVIYHGMTVNQLYKTANLLYTQTLHRASPYILGTIVGYHIKKFENKFDVPKAFAALGWILSFTFGFYSIVSPSHLSLKSYKYDVREAAQYAALSPIAWSLALSWLIVACHFGYGGILNEFLCRKIFIVFSRISYSVYLTQFLVFFYKVGVKRIPEMFTFTGSVNVIEFFLVIGISIIVTLLFDLPMMEIKKILLDKKESTNNPTEDEIKEDPVKESMENSQMQDDVESGNISGEDSQELTEELAENIENENEYDENLDEEEADEEEIESEEADEEIDDNEGVVEEVFEIRPLKRSTRMHFSDDSDDKECFKIEAENLKKDE